jgi:hypothetical protein
MKVACNVIWSFLVSYATNKEVRVCSVLTTTNKHIHIHLIHHIQVQQQKHTLYTSYINSHGYAVHTSNHNHATSGTWMLARSIWHMAHGTWHMRVAFMVRQSALSTYLMPLFQAARCKLPATVADVDARRSTMPPVVFHFFPLFFCLPLPSTVPWNGTALGSFSVSFRRFILDRSTCAHVGKLKRSRCRCLTRVLNEDQKLPLRADLARHAPPLPLPSPVHSFQGGLKLI